MPPPSAVPSIYPSSGLNTNFSYTNFQNLNQNIPQNAYLETPQLPSDLQQKFEITPKLEMPPPNKNIADIQNQFSVLNPGLQNFHQNTLQQPLNQTNLHSAIQPPLQPTNFITNNHIQARATRKNNNIANPQPARSSVMLETTSGKRKRSYQHIQDPAERRRVRNRESAKAARQNKKNYIAQLEENQRSLRQKNEILKAENEEVLFKMKQLVDASDMKEEEVESMIGSTYFERISNGGTHYDGQPTENYHDYQHEDKKEHLPKVHVKQEFEIDGRTSSLETYGTDVHGVVTINRNIDHQSQQLPISTNAATIPVPAPITAVVKAGIRSPSTSSGYTSEGKPVSSPIEIYQISDNNAQIGNNQQPHNQIGIVSNNQIDNSNPHYGIYTSTAQTNMFNYDSQIIQNGVQIMMGGGGGNGSNNSAQPDKLISMDQDQQKPNEERYDNNNPGVASNLVDQAMFLSGINS